MSHPSPGNPSAASDRRRFATTHWSLVVEAGRQPSPQSQRALSALCETYWYPLYAYVRRRGHSAEDAQDLTQEFFALLLEKQWLKAADRERGRFRTFLLTAFQRFLGKERERRRTAKRGGGRTRLSLDFQSAEQRYQLEPADRWTPERVYERRWALTILDQVLSALQQESAAQGKSALFEHLKVYLAGASPAASYAETAECLGISEGAVKVAVHRLRQRYRHLLRVEIGQTLASADEVDDELNRLLEALRGDEPRSA